MADETVMKITIPLALYNEIIKDSEKLNVLKRMVKKDRYITNNELREILDIEESEV